MWDDKYYYNIKFEEDIFIKIFFELLFKHGYKNYTFLFNKQYLQSLLNVYFPQYYLYVANTLFYRNFFTSELKLYKIILFLMRFHILRFNNNIIIFIRIFFPLKVKKPKKHLTKSLRNLFKFYKFIHFNTLFTKIKNNFFFKNF